MTDQSRERRRFQRIEFDAPTRLTQGTRNWNSVLHDISLKGLMVETPTDWNADTDQPFAIIITLDDATQVTMEAVLTRVQPNYLGFVCRHIDLESISHLRRLVELNLGDQSLLERELAALGDPA